jgi:hypothetical protein
MKIPSVLILALLLTTTSCSPQKKYPLQSKEAASADWTLPYGEWSFSFITPYELPAEALHARVIDTDGYLYTFNTLDQTAPASDSVDKWASPFMVPVSFQQGQKTATVHRLLLGFVH